MQKVIIIGATSGIGRELASITDIQPGFVDTKMAGIYHPALVADRQIDEMDAGFPVPANRMRGTSYKLTFYVAMPMQLALILHRYPLRISKFVCRTLLPWQIISNQKRT